MTTSLGQTVLYNVITPVRLIATANVAGSYYNGPANNGVGATLTVAASSLTIDSVVVDVNDRVLLQNQTSAYQNGIYIVKTIASTVVLQRSDDQQTIEQLKGGQFTMASAGTVNQGAAFTLVEPLPQNIGIDPFLWVASSVNSGGLSSTLTSAHIYVGNGSNVATDVPVSGDVTLSNTGVITIPNNSLNYNKLALDVSQLLPVSLTATDIEDMYATPFLLIPAAGPGNIILIDDIFTAFFYGGTQFTGGGDTAAQYGNANHGAGPKASARIDNATINGLTADTCILLAGGANAVVANRTSVVNTAVYLSNNNAAYATGNSAMVLYIRYRIQSA